MNKQMGTTLRWLAVSGLVATSASASDRFSILNEGFLQGGGVSGQALLARHDPDTVLAPQSARVAPVPPTGDLESQMEAEQKKLASLFAGRSGTSLFRDLPKRIGSGAVQKLLDLIAGAEAGKAQYDAVQYAAKIKPRKRPTDMTVSEIYAWIKATPGQQHAIGRYQFIPATLRRLIKKVGAKPTDRFSPNLQDRLAHQLLEEAGLSAVLAGKIGRRDFMLNLAKIWAGLPTANGKSYYHGLAGNRAVLSWARFDKEMARLFPSG